MHNPWGRGAEFKMNSGGGASGKGRMRVNAAPGGTIVVLENRKVVSKLTAINMQAFG